MKKKVKVYALLGDHGEFAFSFRRRVWADRQLRIWQSAPEFYSTDTIDVMQLKVYKVTGPLRPLPKWRKRLAEWAHGRIDVQLARKERSDV